MDPSDCACFAEHSDECVCGRLSRCDECFRVLDPETLECESCEEAKEEAA